ncbi:lysine transporter [Escherichia coli]|nr:lysine transporter [Escherichia coli]
MIVGFSFQGTELIGIAAGESEDPAKNIPRAVRQVFWRILLFYGVRDPDYQPDYSVHRSEPAAVTMLKTSALVRSPWCSSTRGLLSAAAVMNAVILTAVLSAGNSGMYASTRMLYTLACDGKAPRIFAKLSRGGVPRNALYATTVIAGLCFLTSMFGNQTVYLWLLNTSGMTGFIAWLGIAISHYRFRRGYVLQGHDINDLPYRSGFFPLGPIFAFILCLIITLGQNYEAFLKDTIDWGGVAATYIGIPLFLIIWFGYKLIKGTHFVRYSEMKFPQNDKK